MVPTTDDSGRRRVVLCDHQGQPLGVDDVRAAHRMPGKLHQAYSVFVFRDGGRQLLIQQRSATKPLFALRWANTCCSHPTSAAEDPVAAAQRRLLQECGFTVPLERAGQFVYRAEDPGGAGVEHEYDMVLVGHADSDVAVRPDPEEVANWKWVAVDELQADLNRQPDRYAPWLPEALRTALGR